MGRIDNFVHKFRVGDIVVVPKRGADDVMIGIIQSGYIYKAEKTTEGYCHQRKVIWQIKTSRCNLPLEVQRFLYKRPATCMMKTNSEIVRAMLNAKRINLDQVNEVSCSETIPSTKNIDPLIDVALSIIRQELKHADSNQRLKIAFDILNIKTKS